MLKKYKINLSIDELKLIDGKVSANAQLVIDDAKKENSYGFSLPIINEILLKSESIGTFNYCVKDMTYCSVCKKSTGYARYKSGRNKGQSNFKQRIYFNGYKFNSGFITIEHHGDICCDCEKKYNVIDKVIKYILDNDLKVEIKVTDFISKYIKDDQRICYKCKSDIYESEMGKQNTIIGNGEYPGICPKCGAESEFLCNSHKITNEFRMILNRLYIEEVKNESNSR